jgi:geranylgeranyl diphosphate synthase type II
MPAACAVELIHNYSLIHDDLPCMDDDDLRRGQKTCHKKFNEETALLAGDALLTLAFQALSLTSKGSSAKHLERQLVSASWIAEAAGSRGMVGGQAVDLEYQDQETELPTIEYINMHKTGALIAVCLRTGAYLGGGTKSQVEALFRYGKYVGLLFQIVDDIMDREGYARAIGVPEARKQAEVLLSKAKKELGPFGQKGLILSQIADFVLTRNY